MTTTDPRAASHHAEELAHDFERALRGQGLHAALRVLNTRTRHRFTGLWRFDPPVLRSVCLFDRENPHLHLGADAILEETYCGLVGAGDAPFRTDDAAADPRLASHAARESVLAYCGVPVYDEGGRCAGTLCHYDPRPRLAPPGEKDVLARAARLLARHVGPPARLTRDAPAGALSDGAP